MTQETKTQYVTKSIIHGNAKVQSSPRHYGWRTISDDEELKGRYCLEWWIKLLSAHGIDNYARVMYVMEQREIVEAIVTLLLNGERGSIIPPSFLFGMLKIRITIDISTQRHLIS
ncbi:hypothetical protein F2Q69_00054109 [Brassica cretica]|uniref:Uncharacterized protein n=1 Tax=Brassica cretica TaxID=69181 RepID=A0A8S9N541_BRACR|nr:hypothetical protein F2Q69_00054109 [Brassica cretica]